MGMHLRRWGVNKEDGKSYGKVWLGNIGKIRLTSIEVSTIIEFVGRNELKMNPRSQGSGKSHNKRKKKKSKSSRFERSNEMPRSTNLIVENL